MKNALNLVIAFLAFIIPVGELAASSKISAKPRYTKEQEIVLSQIELERQFIQLVRDSIPVKFQDDFLLETRGWDIRERLRIMAQAVLESHNWTKMESYQANADGSTDVGPLGLNTNNIKNPDFVAHFWPRDRMFTDENILYMVVCIRYERPLFDEFGCGNSQLIAYNAGRNAALGIRPVPDSTVNYIRVVNQNQAEISKEYYKRVALAVSKIRNGQVISPPLFKSSFKINDSGVVHQIHVIVMFVQGDLRRLQVVHNLAWSKILDWKEIISGVADVVHATNAGEHVIHLV